MKLNKNSDSSHGVSIEHYTTPSKCELARFTDAWRKRRLARDDVASQCCHLLKDRTREFILPMLHNYIVYETLVYLR